MRPLSTAILTLLVAALVVAAAALAYMYSGRYNVAATAPHNALSRWILQTTQKNSVREHAEKVGEPPRLAAEEVRQAAGNFDKMCVVCHGAPGVERGEYGKGITPTPPDLAKEAAKWSERELFWIVKHGIKFAGMPAFGPTHSDEEIWGLVAFLKRLPQMSPAEYRQLAQSKPAAAGGGHSHK